MKKRHNILLWLALTSAILSGWQDLSAQTEKVIKDSKKDLTEIFYNTNIEQLSHEQIIKSKISDLIIEYWLEKTQELVREHIINEINIYRVSQNLPILKKNNILERLAQEHARDMARNGVLSHTNSQGKTVKEVFLEWGYDPKYAYTGQNIAYWPATIQELIENRLKSPVHKANIENSNFEEMGIWFDFWDIHIKKYIEWKIQEKDYQNILFWTQNFWKQIEYNK